MVQVIPLGVLVVIFLQIAPDPLEFGVWDIDEMHRQ